ncbi:MAG TPA: ABC transporter permease [Kineosporiaceae bacterium]
MSIPSDVPVGAPPTTGAPEGIDGEAFAPSRGRPIRSVAARRSPPGLVTMLVRFQSLLALVLVFVGGIVFSPRRDGQPLFLTTENLANIVRSVSETGIIAVGMTFVIIAGGIDLSVGAVLGLAGVATATLLVDHGWDGVPAVVAVVLAGGLFGLAQGAVSARLRIQAFIVTLAGLQVARGLARIASGDKFINISYGDGPHQASPSFAHLGDRIFGVLPVSALVFLLVGAAASVLLNTTRFGRHVFAVGGNERAARLSGISVQRVRIATFGLCGMLAATSGILHSGQLNFANPNDGTGYELTAIAAVVIGGTSLFGGEGSVIGTLAGALLLGALNNVLQLNNVNANLQLIATGLIIVAAAALQTLVRSGSET